MAKPTISDIAKITGYSRTTISRYLNGKYEYMSKDTRDKIANIIEELHYEPNLIARNLRLQKSKSIGVLVSDITNTFSSILYTGIAHAAEEAGYTLNLAITNDDPQREKMYIENMIRHNVDGIILNASGHNVDLIRDINQNHIPIVLVDRPVPATGCDIITSNARDSVYEIMDLFMSRKYTHIALITQKVGVNGTRFARLQAYKEYCATHSQITPLVIEFDSLSDLETQLLPVIHQTQNYHLGLFALNGVVARNLIELLRQHHLSFPENVGIASFDNWPWMNLVGAGLTVIEQETYHMGIESAKQVIQRIEGNGDTTPKYKELPYTIIQRGSL